MLKKVFLGVLGVLAAAIVVVLVLASTKETSFSVERSITVNAPPEEVFAVMSDLRRFKDWSPWQHLDPNMQTTFAGDPGAVGSSYAWEGNDQVGKGKMTIDGITANRVVGVHLEFFAPFAAVNHVDWRMAPAGGGAQVRWIMTGERDFMTKVICVFMDMDAMVGADFQRGLEKLKTLVERS
jgi:uncharacterized protein YndB with AHSA1/START domain